MVSTAHFFANPAIVAVAVVVVLYLRSLASWRARSRGRPLPPGPKGLPIVGNVADMPKVRPWLGFHKLSMKYGNLLYMTVLRQPIIVLGDAHAILEVLEKRSANTSNRKQTQSVLLTGQGWNFGFWEYGPGWKHHRRVFWRHFHPGAVANYKSVQRAVAHRFLIKIMEDKGDLDNHIQFAVSSTILKIAYGIDVKDAHDRTITTLHEGAVGTQQVLASGGFLVDYVPFLRYLPAFLPGGSFKKKFAEWRLATALVREAPFERYQEAVVGDAVPECIVTDVLAGSDGVEKEVAFDPEEVAKDIGGVSFQAGSDTTQSTMKTFLLAMSLYPDVQRKAQAELDAIVGSGRLPDFTDCDSLVYVNAIIKECMRWMNVAPLAMSHATTDDDEFQGYFIPAGTIILANVWACMHDPEAYDEPDIFRPERFIRDGKLDTNVRDPYAFAFGFGRRICPGRYFADTSLFITFASILHVFDITPPLDEDGKEIRIEPTVTNNLISAPEDSRCTIKPRGAWAEALISNAQLEDEFLGR